MPAIEEMCSSIALINHGKLLVKGEISDIKEMHKTSELLLTTRNPLSIPLLLDSGLLMNVEEIAPVKGRKGYSYCILKKEGTRNTDLLQAISIQGEILHFEERIPTLNDIFLNYTTGQPKAVETEQPLQPEPVLN